MSDLFIEWKITLLSWGVQMDLLVSASMSHDTP